MAKGGLLDLGTTLGVDDRLPPRLFATDRYPEGRLNVYSRPDILTVARKVLKGSEQWDKLLNSQFGVLFTLPVGKCSQYGKLLHALMCRELVTKRKYEMWTVFGGHPMRFSLVEFGCVTGLSCAEFPAGYDPYEPCNPVDGEKYYWHELIGKNMRSTLGDVSSLLEDEPKMPMDRKLRLVLILIVDGILISKHQTHKPTFKYVEMLRNIDEFLGFPWGRESFLPTIASLIPTTEQSPRLQEEAIVNFRQQLQQQSKFLLGFPLALQLVALQNISGLLSKSWAAKEKRNFIEWPHVGLTKHSMALKAVHAVELDEKLTVQPLLHPPYSTDEGWGEWDDEITDRKVVYLMKQIRNGHVFQKAEWPGGDASLRLITDVSINDDLVHKKHVILRKRKSSKQNEPSTSSSRRRSKPSHVKTPTELEMFKESMESQMEEIRQNFTAQIAEISQELMKLRSKYKNLKFKRAGVVGSLPSKFSSVSRLRKSRLRKSPPRSETLDNTFVDSLSPDKSGDAIGANNNTEEGIVNESSDDERHQVDDDTGIQDVQIQSTPSEGLGNEDVSLSSENQENSGDVIGANNNSEEGIVNESSDDEGHQVDDDTGIQDVQIQPTPSEGLGNEDVSLSSENLEKSISSGGNGVSEIPNALLPTSDMHPEVISLSGVPFPAAESNISDRKGDAVEGVVGNGSTGLEPPIENTPLSHTFGQPVFDTPTKNITFEADNDHDHDPIYDTVTKPQTSQLPCDTPNLNAIPEPLLITDPLQTGDQPIKLIVHPQADPIHHSDEAVNDDEPRYDTVTKPHSSQPPCHPPKRNAIPDPLQSGEQHIKLIVHPSPDPIHHSDEIPAQGVKKTDNPVHLAPTDPVEHAKQHVDGNDQQTENDIGLQYLLPDGNLNDGCGDTNDGAVQLFELSDSSPPRHKHTRVPSEAESVLVARLLSKPNQDSYDIFPSVDASEFSFFQETLSLAPKTKHITRCGYSLDHQFIIELASPEQWVSTLHMEVLVTLIERRHKESLSIQRATISTPFLCSYILGKIRAFKAARTKSLVHWPEQLVRLINTPGSKWVDDIDTIYVPMIWEDRHWVGLVITLGLWTIEILDPNTDLYPMRDVRKFMDPLAEMLPHVINAHCLMPLSQSHGLHPFRWSRVKDIYRNVRSGDCGPVAMKFLEIEASDSGSDKLALINDDLVDDFRKQYAMDVYKEFIAPVYDHGEIDSPM